MGGEYYEKVKIRIVFSEKRLKIKGLNEVVERYGLKCLNR
jgi:hypothetical protein